MPYPRTPHVRKLIDSKSPDTNVPAQTTPRRVVRFQDGNMPGQTSSRKRVRFQDSVYGNMPVQTTSQRDVRFQDSTYANVPTQAISRRGVRLQDSSYGNMPVQTMFQRDVRFQGSAYANMPAQATFCSGVRVQDFTYANIPAQAISHRGVRFQGPVYGNMPAQATSHRGVRFQNSAYSNMPAYAMSHRRGRFKNFPFGNVPAHAGVRNRTFAYNAKGYDACYSGVRHRRPGNKKVPVRAAHRYVTCRYSCDVGREAAESFSTVKTKGAENMHEEKIPYIEHRSPNRFSITSKGVENTGFEGTSHRNLPYKSSTDRIRWKNAICDFLLKRKTLISKTRRELFWSLVCFLVSFGLFINWYLSLFSEIEQTYVSWTLSFFKLLLAMISIYFGISCLMSYFSPWYDFPFKIPAAYKTLLNIDENEIQQKLWDVQSPDEADSFQSEKFIHWMALNRSQWGESAKRSMIHLPTSSEALSNSFSSFGKPWLPIPSVQVTSRSPPFIASPSPFSATGGAVTPEKSGHEPFKISLSHWIKEEPKPRILSPKEALLQPRNAEEEKERLKRCLKELHLTFERLDFERRQYDMVKSPIYQSMESLSRLRYQRCSKSSESAMDDDAENSCSKNVLTKLGVTERMLSEWSDRIRKWIALTILARIVKEIDEVNNTFKTAGCSSLEIGVANLFTLWNIALGKPEVCPSLPSIVPYLELTLNQEYIVQRLKDLACGNCMKGFMWNSGGSYNNQPWSNDLPCDSTIIMHLFCTYLDSLLPADPSALNGWVTSRPFSYKYIRKAPNKDTTGHYIYQVLAAPPHYEIVIDNETYGLLKGKQNVFSAIALFLHYIKIKHNSMLDRINLGPTGLNILWALEYSDVFLAS